MLSFSYTYKRATLVLAAILLSAISHAQSFSQIYVFGDSLSDTGNLQAFSQDPSIPSRFTNGPVAVEVLAAQLGLNITNALHLTGSQHGNNFAVAGALAIDEDGDESTFDINLPTQINTFLAYNQYQAPYDALYVIMIGGNDIRAARTLLSQDKWGSSLDAYKRLQQASDSVEQQILKLTAAGAQNILLVNAPDIGAIPETDLVAQQLLMNADSWHDQIIANNLEGLTKWLTVHYNFKLKQASYAVEHDTGVKIMRFNLFKFFTDLNANYQDYGYTNNTDACVFVFSAGGAMNPECNFETFIFFDEIHPTTSVHQRAGAALYQTVLRAN